MTQVVVTLDVGNCSPDIVAELIQQQVGFQVVLLDSKCFPILESDTTRGTDYWKSNRKILAASKSLYTRLTGSSANVKRANHAVDLTNSDEERVAPPKSKCCCLSSNKLDKILDTVEAIKERNDVIEKISGLFECVICREIVQRPQFSPCCKRIVGCQQCVRRWFRDHMHAHIALHLVSLTTMQTSGVRMICWGLFVCFVATVLIMALLSWRQPKTMVVAVVTLNYQHSTSATTVLNYCSPVICQLHYLSQPCLCVYMYLHSPTPCYPLNFVFTSTVQLMLATCVHQQPLDHVFIYPSTLQLMLHSSL